MGPISIEEIEKTNTVVIWNSQQGQRGGSRRDLYIMDIDRRINCYSYGEFGHLV